MNGDKCTQCTAGSSCQHNVKTACAGITTSVAGASACTPCPPSTFAARGHTTCLLIKTRCEDWTYNNQCLDSCPNDTYNKTLAGADYCLDCTSCQPNQFETRSCSLQADRQCSSCTVCNRTEYEVAPCTGTSDRVCAACHHGCASCFGPRDDQCNSCSLTLFLDQQKQTCQAGCSPGQVCRSLRIAALIHAHTTCCL